MIRSHFSSIIHCFMGSSSQRVRLMNQYYTNTKVALKGIDDGAQPHCFAYPNDRYHQAYFEVLEHTCGEMDNHYDRKKKSVVLCKIVAVNRCC